MPYIVQAGTGAKDRLSTGGFSCDTAVLAVEKALKLMVQGYENVMIMDPHGRLYDDSEFQELLKKNA